MVAGDIFGASGRKVMATLIECQRDPVVLAEMAGRFTDHHAFLLALGYKVTLEPAA